MVIFGCLLLVMGVILIFVVCVGLSVVVSVGFFDGFRQ